MLGSAMRRAAIMLLLCVLTATTAWAEGDFTYNDDGTYTINNAEGWALFCDALQDNDTYDRFSGKTVCLGADIEVSRMAGTSSDHDFCGTFDGQGHTLTFTYTATEDYTAPFRYVGDGCTIENLRVCGTITTPYKYAAGFIANHIGNVAIRNCRSSIIINSSVDGEGFHAGFVGGSLHDFTINIEGCAFTGSLLGTNTTHCAGFVGYNSGTLTISNSLFAPAEVTVGDTESATFARGNAPTITNCYYTAALGTAQGKQRRRIIAGDFVAFSFLALTGNYTTYNVSRIMAYTGGGLMCVDGGVKYYGKGDPVLFRPSHSNRAGYKFNGYTYSAGSPQGDIIYMPDEDVIVGSTWDIIDYSISYELNGGALPAGKSNPDKYNVETPTFTLYEPVKERYVFAGWYTNDAFTGDAVTAIPVGSTGKMTLYAKWTPVTNNISVGYVDENGDQQTAMALKLDGSETKLTPGWYVVQGAVDFTSTKELSNAITLNGDVNLILADGAEMTVNNIEQNGFGIRGDYTLTIFGQSAGTGRLTLTSGAWGNAIGCYKMVVNGGNVIATNTSDGNATIDVDNLTINGGTVSATSVTTFSAISGEVILNDGQLTVSNTYVYDGQGYSPRAYSGNLTVNGGQFIASSDYGFTLSSTIHFNGGTFSATNTNGTAVDGRLYLNWTRISDSFYASSFDNMGADIAEGKSFIADDVIYSGRVDGDEIAGKTLRPYGAPAELANAVTATTATLSWKGFQEKYNVRYTVSSETVEDFENEETFANWTTISNNEENSSDDDGYGRYSDDSNYCFRFSSYNNAEDYNQYLISPELNGVSIMEFNYRGYDSGEKFKVGYSTTGNDVDDFTFGDEIMTTSEDWVKYSCTLPAGTKYVAINYCSDFLYYLYVDDITFKSIDSWTNVNNVTSPLTITGLTPETRYEWQVQGILDNGVTGWSTGSFTTTDGTDIALYDSGSDALDNTTVIDSNDGEEVNVILLDRTLYKDGDWNTLCVPFDVVIKGSVLDGADVRALSEANLKDDELTLTFTKEGEVSKIEAGKSYLIKWKEGDNLVNPVFENVTVKSNLNNFTSIDGKVSFKGNYAPISWTVDTPSILFVGAENKLHWPLAGAHLNAFRAYFELADGAQARSINLNFGEETSDIVSIDNSQLTIDNEAGAWYTLDGRKVSGKPTTKGLYIFNGKKVVIK